MNDLTHAVGFLQNAYTILLALALGETFKQFVPDGAKKEIEWNRLPSLLALLFLIFPFFHGMGRYLYVMYLSKKPPFHEVAGFLMWDGICFMCLSAFLFVMSRSLSPMHWRRFYISLLCLLVIDSVWAAVALYRGVQVQPWLYLNGALAIAAVCVLASGPKCDSIVPSIFCAVATLVTCIISYFWMSGFYFPG
jgi:hypothetical protein